MRDTNSSKSNFGAANNDYNGASEKPYSEMNNTNKENIKMGNINDENSYIKDLDPYDQQYLGNNSSQFYDKSKTSSGKRREEFDHYNGIINKS